MVVVKSSTQTGCCNLTILEGKKLEDAVHNGDNNGDSQQVRVGLQKGHLYREGVFNLKVTTFNYLFSQYYKSAFSVFGQLRLSKDVVLLHMSYKDNLIESSIPLRS